MKKLLDSYIILKHRKGKYNDEILKNNKCLSIY